MSLLKAVAKAKELNTRLGFYGAIHKILALQIAN